jgi:predicted RNase H-like HicB family nuclease
MMTLDCERENKFESYTVDPSKWGPRTKDYRCHVCLTKEDDGSFSAIVLNLPGAGSCGDTEEDALRNVREAILGVIESHQEAGEVIPWQDADESDIPTGAQQKWILVNA